LAAWLALASLLLWLVPLFLCMPLTTDACFYDICARDVLRGGALEKDFVFLVPPGMAWALAAVRATLGGSSFAARLADLLVVGAVVALLVRWLRDTGMTRGGCVWSAVLLCAFYLTTSEGCQVQPDTWMLLPAVAALHLRRRQVARSHGWFAWGAAEGLLWGAACLIKPYVVVPGLLTWLASALVVRRSGPGWRARLARDTGGLLVGGLLMGAIWQGSLLAHGTFADYWHTVALYRGDYYSRTANWAQRGQLMLWGVFPWSLLRLAALPLALLTLVPTLTGPLRVAPASAIRPQPLLAGLYLGWLAQAALIQGQYAYHMTPVILLAITQVASWLACRPWGGRGWLTLGIFGLAAVAYQPACRPHRLALWAECWHEGSTPTMHDRLHLDAGPTWVELDHVADFLREQRVGDRDVLCYDTATIPLQPALGIQPPTRYILPSGCLYVYSSHQASIRQELMAGPQRFIVTDADDLVLKLSPPQARCSWPYTEPEVFCAGRYHVYRAPSGAAPRRGAGAAGR